MILSPNSFPLGLLRRAWTWLPTVTGRGLFLIQRVLAKLAGINLHRDREIREYVTAEEAIGAEEELQEEWDGDDEVCYYRVRLDPLTRRESALYAFGRFAARLANVRSHWQAWQMARLVLEQVTIGSDEQFTAGAGVPTSYFAPEAVDMFVMSAPQAQAITLRFRNGTKRERKIVGALIGSAANG